MTSNAAPCRSAVSARRVSQRLMFIRPPAPKSSAIAKVGRAAPAHKDTRRDGSGANRKVPRTVGPGRWDEDGEKRIPLDVSVGDTVLYSKYGGTEVKYSGEEYLILSARDVLAVVER